MSTYHGEQIRQAREAKGLSQRDLAEAVGTSQPYVSLLERGAKRGGSRVLRKIAEALEVPYRTLMGYDREPSPTRQVPLNGFVREDGTAASSGLIDIIAPGAVPRGGDASHRDPETGLMGDVEMMLVVNEFEDTDGWFAVRAQAGSEDGRIMAGDVLVMRPTEDASAPALVACIDEDEEHVTVGFLETAGARDVLFPLTNSGSQVMVVDGEELRVIAQCVELRRRMVPHKVD